ncbi:Non-homologous end-joining factor 1 [Labeo rohita]|uniref:Non-homologous end-joining factor 1 n=1 Tax=Labeo rohita TaxID=84645 RepID=A0ABQ8MK66_LABRO|nr:Non-homologous end-joining factor 1 [Labeo rohita]
MIILELLLIDLLNLCVRFVCYLIDFFLTPHWFPYLQTYSRVSKNENEETTEETEDNVDMLVPHEVPTGVLTIHIKDCKLFPNICILIFSASQNSMISVSGKEKCTKLQSSKDARGGKADFSLCFEEWKYFSIQIPEQSSSAVNPNQMMVELLFFEPAARDPKPMGSTFFNILKVLNEPIVTHQFDVMLNKQLKHPDRTVEEQVEKSLFPRCPSPDNLQDANYDEKSTQSDIISQLIQRDNQGGRDTSDLMKQIEKRGSFCDMCSAIVSSTQCFAFDQELSDKIHPSETVKMTTFNESGEVKVERDQSGPLFVNNLHPNVTEQVLLSTFLPFGPICFVQVCRDKATNLSRGFGFVTFAHHHNAENARDTLIFSELLGKPMRIMWAQHDSTLRKSGIGNIIIKGLARDIDDLALYDTFSCFGEVLSSRVVCDSNGQPKGYGFVHYATCEAAELAIKKLDGMLLNDHLVSIRHYKPYNERQADQNGNSKCCEKKDNNICEKPAIVSSTQGFALDQDLPDKNPISETVKMTTSCSSGEVKVERDQSGPLFVGNLHPHVTEQVLLSTFLPFGPICFVQVCRDRATNLSRGFGFLLGKPMCVMWAQHDSTLRKSGIGNIIIKGLAKDIDDLALYDTFSCFGEVLSSRVVCDSNGQPKGYGFVHYATLEAAELAIKKLDGMLLNDHLVSISHHNPYKEWRVDQNVSSKSCQKKDYGLYISNLPYSLRSEELCSLFSAFGYVTSAKVMMYNSRSRGYGFVSYSSINDAVIAVSLMNGYIVGNRPLKVALSYSVEKRKLHKLYKTLEKCETKQEVVQFLEKLVMRQEPESPWTTNNLESENQPNTSANSVPYRKVPLLCKVCCGEMEAALFALPWVPVNIGGSDLLAKAWFGDTQYRVLLSDLNTDLNKRLRAPTQAFFSHLCSVARPCFSGQDGDQISAAHVTLEQHGDNLTVKLKSELAGVPFYWEFRCTTMPVGVRQVEDLAALLARKDAEIQDYQENGAVLSRARLQTEPFEVHKFRENFLTQVRNIFTFSLLLNIPRVNKLRQN